MPILREFPEMWYEFAEPFVLNSSKIQRAFGLRTTLEESVPATVEWFRRRAASAASGKAARLSAQARRNLEAGAVTGPAAGDCTRRAGRDGARARSPRIVRGSRPCAWQGASSALRRRRCRPW